MSTNVIKLLNAIINLQPVVMIFLISLAAIVVTGMALVVVLVMLQK